LSRVVWGRTPEEPADQAAEFDRIFSALGLVVSRGETWAVKLNLTYPRPVAGIVTSALTAEGLAIWGRERGVRLTFVESDGGNNSHKASDALRDCGFVEIAKKYDGAVHSLTDDAWIPTEMSVGGKDFKLELSEWMLARPFDRLVDMPVIKTHIFTSVSLGIKNLWGCIPNPLRMYNHHLLDYGIVGLAKTLHPDLLILDGRTALDGNGPINGTPIPAKTLVVADSVGAGDWVTTCAMGFEPARIRHLQLALAEGVVPDPREVTVVGEQPSTLPGDFRMERTLYNWATIVANWSPRLQKLVYHSPISKYLYAAVTPFRKGTPAEAVKRISY